MEKFLIGGKWFGLSCIANRQMDGELWVVFRMEDATKRRWLSRDGKVIGLKEALGNRWYFDSREDARRVAMLASDDPPTADPEWEAYDQQEA